jgi:Tfp pilus assembly protein FimT
MCIKQRGAGLLLELCIVGACIGLLSFFAMPALLGLSSKYRETLLMKQLEQSIHLAKNEALSRQQPMLLCASQDGRTCAKQTHWGPYWLLGEAATEGSLANIQLKAVLRVYPVPSTVQLEFKSFYGGTPHYLTVLPNGWTHNNGTFTCGHIKLIVNHLLRTFTQATTLEENP